MARFLKALYAEADIADVSSHSGRRTLITRLAVRVSYQRREQAAIALAPWFVRAPPARSHNNLLLLLEHAEMRRSAAVLRAVSRTNSLPRIMRFFRPDY
jgi:hypothetical protein